MRRHLLQTAVLTLAVVLSGCVASRTTVVRSAAPGVVTVETFDNYLSPYGTWMNLPGYGRVWQPSPSYVGAGFYPYGTGGQWVMSDAGWVFDSSYPFSWAVFHYGRWHRDPFYGWCWLPGTQWAPAWVSWRTGGPYVGWAPLGPYGAPAYAQHTWTFVEARRFTGRDAYRYSVSPGRFHEAVSVTQPYRAGPPATYISRATNREIRPIPVERLQTSRGPLPPPPPSQRSYGAPASPAVRSDPGYSRSNQPLPPPPSSAAPGYSRGNQPLPPPPPPSAGGGYRRDGFSAPGRSYAPPPSAPAPQYSKPPSYGAPRSSPSWGRSSAPPPPPPSMSRPSYRSPSMPSRPAPPPPPRR